MKRNTLLIAIAAIAVVCIAVGLLVSGALNAGPLSGALGPAPTSLTLGYTIGMEDGMGGYGLDLHGKLTSGAGSAVANRAVRVRFTVPGDTTIHDAGTATTGADGTYSVQFQQLYFYYGKHPVYYAEFAGDSAYLASRSPNVAGP